SDALVVGFSFDDMSFSFDLFGNNPNGQDDGVLFERRLPGPNKKSPRPGTRIEDFVVFPLNTPLCRTAIFIEKFSGNVHTFLSDFLLDLQICSKTLAKLQDGGRTYKSMRPVRT